MESQVEVEISSREIHILLCCCIGSGSEGQTISCSTLLARLVRSRMPRFSMGGGSPKAAARPTASGTVVSLRDLVARTHPPVTSISTKGRIVYLFGTSQKYPCHKFIQAGESGWRRWFWWGSCPLQAQPSCAHCCEVGRHAGHRWCWVSLDVEAQWSGSWVGCCWQGGRCGAGAEFLRRKTQKSWCGVPWREVWAK